MLGCFCKSLFFFKVSWLSQCFAKESPFLEFIGKVDQLIKCSCCGGPADEDSEGPVDKVGEPVAVVRDALLFLILKLCSKIGSAKGPAWTQELPASLLKNRVLIQFWGLLNLKQTCKVYDQTQTWVLLVDKRGGVRRATPTVPWEQQVSCVSGTHTVTAFSAGIFVTYYLFFLWGSPWPDLRRSLGSASCLPPALAAIRHSLHVETASGGTSDGNELRAFRWAEPRNTASHLLVSAWKSAGKLPTCANQV